MDDYIALIDGKPGSYGAVFPDVVGCTANGMTIDETLSNARLALGEWIEFARAEGLTMPRPRTADELLKDPEVIEQMKEGATLLEVGYDILD